MTITNVNQNTLGLYATPNRENFAEQSTKSANISAFNQTDSITLSPQAQALLQNGLAGGAPTQYDLENISPADRQTLSTQLLESGEISLLQAGLLTQDIAIKNSLGIEFDALEPSNFLQAQRDYLDFLRQDGAAPTDINTQFDFIQTLERVNTLI